MGLAILLLVVLAVFAGFIFLAASWRIIQGGFGLLLGLGWLILFSLRFAWRTVIRPAA